MEGLDVLHLVGSPTSRFHAELSRVYARDVLRPAGTCARFASVEPDGAWRLGESIDGLGAPVPPAQALARLGRPDVVVPHVFCPTGMVTLRAMLEDVLGLAVVGAHGSAALVATDKALTRAALAGTGVHVPAGEVVTGDGAPALEPPYLVKPAREDNSRGVQLVADAARATAALEEARRYDDRVVVERFVPGREFRVAVLERDGALHVPAIIEYPLDSAHPVRTTAHKLALDGDGCPTGQPADAAIRCPAPISPAVRGRLADAARRAHVALEGRDYSLLDFRVEARTGTAFVIEACSFWSFSSISMITRMVRADGERAEDVALQIWRAAAGRGPRPPRAPDTRSRSAPPEDFAPARGRASRGDAVPGDAVRGDPAATPTEETNP